MEKIAFIIYETDSMKRKELLNNLAKLKLPESLEAECIVIKDASSCAAAYNEGMRQSKAKYKFYISEDARILDKDIVASVLQVFGENPRISMVGVTGVDDIPQSGISWHGLCRKGRMEIVGKDYVWSRSERPYEPVLMLDGVFFATQYDLPWQENGGRQENLAGSVHSLDFRRRTLMSAVLGGQGVHVACLRNGTNFDEEELEWFQREYLQEIRSMGLKRCTCCGSVFEKYQLFPLHFALKGMQYHSSSGKSEMLNKWQYLCPSCCATDRDRAYATWMNRSLDRKKTLKILDIAPSPCLSAFIKRTFPQADYRTADLFMEGVDYRLDVMDMKQIGNDSIDFFICSHVLEHVKDDVKAMKELRRVLKPDGCGILVVPIDLNQRTIDEDPDCTDPDERWRRFGQDDHVRKYSRQGYLERLERARFVVRQYRKDFFCEDIMYENGLSDTVNVYVVAKY